MGWQAHPPNPGLATEGRSSRSALLFCAAGARVGKGCPTKSRNHPILIWPGSVAPWPTSARMTRSRGEHGRASLGRFGGSLPWGRATLLAEEAAPASPSGSTCSRPRRRLGTACCPGRLRYFPDRPRRSRRRTLTSVPTRTRNASRWILTAPSIMLSPGGGRAIRKTPGFRAVCHSEVQLGSKRMLRSGLQRLPDRCRLPNSIACQPA